MLTDEIFAGYKIRKLGLHDNIEQFDCGDEDLNDFIINGAPLYRHALAWPMIVYQSKIFLQILILTVSENISLSTTSGLKAILQ